MSKMAVIGEGDGILVFKAAGVEAFPAENEKKAKEILRSIAKDYAVIFLSEKLYANMEDFLKRFNEAPYPVILALPDGSGYGMEELRKTGERALGVDILFKSKN